jgi:hypothetical protein
MRAILLLLLLTGCAGLREVPCYGVADEVGRRIVPGPDINASKADVEAMERRGVLALEYPGFYRLAEPHRRRTS